MTFTVREEKVSLKEPTHPRTHTSSSILVIFCVKAIYHSPDVFSAVPPQPQLKFLVIEAFSRGAPAASCGSDTQTELPVSLFSHTSDPGSDQPQPPIVASKILSLSLLPANVERGLKHLLSPK